MMCIEFLIRSYKIIKFVVFKYVLRYLWGGIVFNLFVFISIEIFKYDEMYSNSDRISGNLFVLLVDVI